MKPLAPRDWNVYKIRVEILLSMEQFMCNVSILRMRKKFFHVRLVEKWKLNTERLEAEKFKKLWKRKFIILVWSLKFSLVRRVWMHGWLNW